MQLKQYYLECLSHASYLITDERSGTAAVIDPQRDVDQYVADAEAAGCRIAHVFLTHFHADFLAGHIELRDRCGATIYMGRRAQAEFEMRKVQEGDVVEFGDVRLSILETPGHTPEGISILVHDLSKDAAKPQAVLTGDTLFVGDVGRPDLLASIGYSAGELADMLHESLTTKLITLPEETRVYPAHGAGSLCGKNLGPATVSTIGEEKRSNAALRPMSREDFKKLVTSGQLAAPRYFLHDALRNRQERPALEKVLSQSLQALTLEAVLELVERGAQILDTRDADRFEQGHLAGAINIGIRGKFATWCGSILDADRTIVVIADPGTEEEAVIRLGRIGFDGVAGYLAGGMQALSSRPELVRRISRITASQLAHELENPEPPVVIDVRAEREWVTGHIDGSLNIPLPQLREKMGEVPQNRPVVLHCEGGYRSAIAASLLAREGLSGLRDLEGGFKAWMLVERPVARPVVDHSPREQKR